MATYRGSYIASAFRSRIDVTVADKSGDNTKSVVTVSVYVEMASGARDGAWNFAARGAVGADSDWPEWYQCTSSSYLNGTSAFIKSYTREYAKGATAQTVMAYGQVKSTYTWSSSGASDARGSVTIPALATYPVTYDANGGTGAPSAQVKVKGQALTLSSATPTRANYVFLGWATSDSATTATYAPGATYSTDAALDLYAVWELAYIAPTFVMRAYRSDSSGNQSPNSDTHITMELDWSLSQVGGAQSSAVVALSFADTGGSRSETVTLSAATGTAEKHTYAASSGETFDSGSSYLVSATITDDHGLSTSATVTIPSCFYLYSFGYEGKSMGIGKLASDSAQQLDFGSALPPVFEDPVQWREALGGSDTGVWTAAMIPSLAASKITSGTLGIARIRNVAWTYIFGDASAANFVRWSAFGRTVIVQVNIESGTSIGTSAVTLGTIANTTYRPDKTISVPLYHSSNNTGCLWVNTDGTVKVSTKASSAQTTGYGIVVFRASA